MARIIALAIVSQEYSSARSTIRLRAVAADMF
jgi:hypothetical protein